MQICKKPDDLPDIVLANSVLVLSSPQPHDAAVRLPLYCLQEQRLREAPAASPRSRGYRVIACPLAALNSRSPASTWYPPACRMLPSADVDPRGRGPQLPSFTFLGPERKQELEAAEVRAQHPREPFLLPACPSYSCPAVAWLLLPLCLSPPVLFTAPFPLVSTDRSTKCFPSLPAIFIPFIRVISFVNSFLAQRRQPYSVLSSTMGTGRVRAPREGRAEQS